MDGKQQNLIWAALTVAVVGLATWYFWGELSATTLDNTQGKTQQQALLAEAGSQRINLLRTLNPEVKDVSGELVWLPSKQQGILHIQALPQPPAQRFYQVWMYDTRGSMGAPISLAKVSASGWNEDNYIHLKGDRPITEAYKFVLTLETDDDDLPEQILLMAQP